MMIPLMFLLLELLLVLLWFGIAVNNSKQQYCGMVVAIAACILLQMSVLSVIASGLQPMVLINPSTH